MKEAGETSEERKILLAFYFQLSVCFDVAGCGAGVCSIYRSQKVWKSNKSERCASTPQGKSAVSSPGLATGTKHHICAVAVRIATSAKGNISGAVSDLPQRLRGGECSSMIPAARSRSSFLVILRLSDRIQTSAFVASPPVRPSHFPCGLEDQRSWGCGCQDLSVPPFLLTTLWILRDGGSWSPSRRGVIFIHSMGREGLYW